MLRLAALINRGRAGLSAISLTLDSHHRFDIAHPPFWIAADGAGRAIHRNHRRRRARRSTRRAIRPRCR
jgi:hypothetical protein